MSWRVLGCSAAGDAHLLGGRGCEDALRWEALPDGSIALAVADGLGSESLGATGAALAADALVLEAVAALRAREPADADAWRRLLEDVVALSARRVRAAIGAFAPGTDPHAAGATIALAVVRRPWLAAVVVGDCFVLVERLDGSQHVLLRPWEGDGPVTLTATLVGVQPGQVRAVVARDPGVCGVILSSDGLASVALQDAGSPTEHVHQPFIAPIIEHAVSGADPNGLAAQLLSATDIRGRTADDRTILVAVDR